MFSSPRPNSYKSSEDFSVEVPCRTGIRYREADSRMFVDSEGLIGSPGMAVYQNTIQRYDPPDDNVPVPASDRHRILKNVRDAFRSQGFEVDVI